MKQLDVLQTVTLGWGTGLLNGALTAGMRVKRLCPIGTPVGVPSMAHNGTGFYTPIRFS